MIFPVVSTESKVQIDDMTRIDATRSFISADEAAITLVEIEPEASSGYIDVTSSKYLDWAYATAGDKVVSVRITTDGSPTTKTATVTVVTAAADLLFTSDQDIITHEPEVFRFLRPGRASFLDFHRKAQEKILDSLRQRNITNYDGTKITAGNIHDQDDVKQWSKYLTISMIYESVQNEVEDIFAIKARDYMSLAKRASERATLELDKDEDGTADSNLDLKVIRMVRR